MATTLLKPAGTQYESGPNPSLPQPKTVPSLMSAMLNSGCGGHGGYAGQARRDGALADVVVSPGDNRAVGLEGHIVGSRPRRWR